MAEILSLRLRTPYVSDYGNTVSVCALTFGDKKGIPRQQYNLVYLAAFQEAVKFMACLLSSIMISYYSLSERNSGKFIGGTETGSDKLYL